LFNPDIVEFKLINNPKTNQLNCFLNSVIQVIWHVDILRQVINKFLDVNLNDKPYLGPEYNLLIKF